MGLSEGGEVGESICRIRAKAVKVVWCWEVLWINLLTAARAGTLRLSYLSAKRTRYSNIVPKAFAL